MADKTETIDVDAACARLRDVLTETRGLGRRELLAALGRTFAGSALLATAARNGIAGEGRRAAGDRLRVWRRVEEIRHHGIRRAVHQADRNPGRLSGPLHIRQAARHARGQGDADRRRLGAGRRDLPGQAHEHDHAARFQRHRPLGAVRAPASARQRHRRPHAVLRHLLQQEEMARRAPSEILGGFLGRAEIPGPPRASARGGLEQRGRAQGRRRQGQRILSARHRRARSAASTASSRTSRRGIPTIRWPSN